MSSGRPGLVSRALLEDEVLARRHGGEQLEELLDGRRFIAFVKTLAPRRRLAHKRLDCEPAGLVPQPHK